MSDHCGIPHLLLVAPRPEAVGKLVGLPIALSVALRPHAIGEFERSVVLRTVSTDVTDAAAILATAREVDRRRRIDAMLGMTELSLYPCSVAGAAMGVRVNRPAAVARAMDKALMRRRLAELGLDGVGYQVCTQLAEAEEFMRHCPGGMILKPVDGNGGTGVCLVHEAAEVASAWAFTTTAAGAWSVPGPGGRVVLAEEYVAGREYSVESISAGGQHRVLAVTAKHTTGPPHFVELGHDLPAPLPVKERLLVTEAACRALDAIGQQWGPCHTEVMLLGDRAVVIEINVRLGGDRIWEMTELATGVNMVTGAVSALAFGELPPAPVTAARGAAIRFLTAPPGRVVSVAGLEEALGTDGVVRVSELCEVGALVPALTDSWGRLGYVLAAGDDLESAVRAGELAASKIVIQTIPDG